jgi:hypothetical protein
MTADADAVFNGVQKIFMSNVASRAPALNIPLAEMAALQELQNRWKTAYAATQDPATCTKGAVKEKQKARDAYEAGWNKLIRTYLTYNPALTDKGSLPKPSGKSQSLQEAAQGALEASQDLLEAFKDFRKSTQNLRILIQNYHIIHQFIHQFKKGAKNDC